MWQCDNCGYTDEDGTTFEEETEEGSEDTVRYCPECGSDEVFMVDEEGEGDDDFEDDDGDDDEDGDDVDNWDDDDDDDDTGDGEDEW